MKDIILYKPQMPAKKSLDIAIKDYYHPASLQALERIIQINGLQIILAIAIFYLGYLCANIFWHQPETSTTSATTAITESESTRDQLKDQFLMQKQLLITQTLINQKVARPDQLDDPSLLALNRQISNLFKKLVLSSYMEDINAYNFFSEEASLKIIETALMEQTKFNIPASFLLAEAARRTGFGLFTPSGNHFPGIVPDSAVSTPWESFRQFSRLLSSNQEYAPLFTLGKDSTRWTEKLASLEKETLLSSTTALPDIINKYSLSLLDY